MSVRVMSLAWAIELPPGDKLVLLALADCANDEGHCWPGLASLARKTGKCKRSLQESLRLLDREGHITRVENPGKGMNYTVHPVIAENPASQSWHYLYRIEDADTGEYYIGARSCSCDPDKDRYMGSGEWAKAATSEGRQLSKIILGIFETREALAVAEQAATAAVFGQKLCKNRKVATPGTLRPAGVANPATGTGGKKSPVAKSAATGGKICHPPVAKSAPKPSKNHKEPSPIKKCARALPDDWEPSEFSAGSESRKVVDGWPPGEEAVQLEMFRAHHGKKDDKFVDWQKAWSTWVLNTRKFGIGRNERVATPGIGRTEAAALAVLESG